MMINLLWPKSLSLLRIDPFSQLQLVQMSCDLWKFEPRRNGFPTQKISKNLEEMAPILHPIKKLASKK